MGALMRLIGFSTERWWRVVTPYYVAAVIERDGIVVQAAPILKWAKGQPLAKVIAWCEKKGHDCRELPPG